MPHYTIACSRPAPILPDFIAELKDCIDTYEVSHSNASNNSAFPSEPDDNETYLTDRRYYGQRQQRGNYGENYSNRGESNRPLRTSEWGPGPGRPQRPIRQGSRPGTCFVCGKENCWSSNHTQAEKSAAFNRRRSSRTEQMTTEQAYQEDQMMLADLLGETTIEALDVHDDGLSLGDYTEAMMTSVVTTLGNRACEYLVTSTAKTTQQEGPFSFLQTTRYNDHIFYGVMIDTEASSKFTAGFGQYKAFDKIIPTPINTTRAGQVNIQFAIGQASRLGSINVQTPVGTICFHIVQADTPFLLCLADMDRHDVFFDNTRDSLVSKTKAQKDYPVKDCPVARLFGHTFLVWGPLIQNTVTTR